MQTELTFEQLENFPRKWREIQINWYFKLVL